jgi:hypothetical protein
MTINQTFGEWELITDEPGDEIYWEHLPSGTRMEFRPDGTMASPAVQTENVSYTDRPSHTSTEPMLWGPEKQLSMRVDVVDTEYVDGRLIGSYFFSDPPYDSKTAGPDHTVDGGSTTNGIHPNPEDSSSRVGLVVGDSIFSFDENPLTVYRAPDYTNQFSEGSNGVLDYQTVLEGQAGSTMQSNGGRFPHAFSHNPETGTIVVGEEVPDNGEAVLYRSTDNGQTWSEVYRLDSEVSNRDEYHIIGKDPFSDWWVAAIGDAGTNRFLVSIDDGETWTDKDLGLQKTDQAVGFDFTEDYIYFSQDQGSGAEGVYHGPWVYRKSDGKTFSLASENPFSRLRNEYGQIFDIGLVHDRDHNVTYILCRDTTTDPTTNGIYAVRGIGGDVIQVEYDASDPNIFRAKDRIMLGDGSIYREIRPPE